MCVGLYSPRISEDLVPVIFRLAVHEGLAMTKLVDDILRTDLHIRGVINDEQLQQNNSRKNISRQ